MRRLQWLAVPVILATACAKKQEVAAGPQKLTIANVRTFDIATCRPRALTATATVEGVTGALLAISPQVQECLVDPKSTDAKVAAKLKATVTATAAYSISGTGLTDAGQACILAAAKGIAVSPRAATLAPLEVEVPIQPIMEPVKLGLNTANDAVGMIRLATPSMCECFVPAISEPAPGPYRAEIHLRDGLLATVKFPAGAIEDCLTAKMKTLKFPTGNVDFAYQFFLKNAYGPSANASAPAPLQNQQWDGIREQRTAEMLMVAGERSAHATSYVEMVKAYNAKPNTKMYPQIREKCQALLDLDQNWVDKLDKLKADGQSALTFVRGEKAKDAAAWTEVESRLGQITGTYDAELERVKALKAADAQSCPKALRK